MTYLKIKQAVLVATLLAFAVDGFAAIGRSSSSGRSYSSSSRSYSSPKSTNSYKSSDSYSSRNKASGIRYKSYGANNQVDKDKNDRVRNRAAFLKSSNGLTPSPELSSRIDKLESSRPGWFGVVATSAVIYALMSKPDTSASDRRYLEERLKEAKEEEARKPAAVSPLKPRGSYLVSYNGLDDIKINHPAHIQVKSSPTGHIDCQLVDDAAITAGNGEANIVWTPKAAGSYVLSCNVDRVDYMRALTVN